MRKLHFHSIITFQKQENQMRLSSKSGLLVLSTILTILAFSAGYTATAQTGDPAVFALQRGFRTGYSDGYMAGYRDTIDGVAKNFSQHAEYTKADRAYNKDYGSIEDYRDGYQQGFESGYLTGYDRKSFEASLPQGLKRRGVLVNDRQVATAAPTVTTTGDTTASTTTETVRIENTAIAVPVYQGDPNAIIVIPRDTELILEIQDDLNTQQSREGDRFTAKVVAPSEIAGAIVEGRVRMVKTAGRIKGRSEMLLSFDRIILSENRWANFSAALIEVMPVKGDNIHHVDNEGTAVGNSSLKSDAVKVGGATGAGALIGGVVGGPVGVAVGAGMGAAFGVGAVVIERGKHVRISRNQSIRIRTAHETQIR
jgi:hypothetical protein